MSTTSQDARDGATLATRAGRRRCLALAALLALAVLPYLHVIGFAFSYDDHWTVRHNRWLSEPAGRLLPALLDGSALALEVPDATRPAMIFSLRIDRALFGQAPAGYHAHSLVLHAMCVLVIGALAFAVARRATVAWVATALFAVTPLHAEAVASIHYREDLLSALGSAGALALLLWPARRPHGWGKAIGVAALWGLALFAKENALALVLVLPVLALVHRGPGTWLRRERSWFALGATLMLWSSWRWALWLIGDDLPVAPAQSAFHTLLGTARYADTAAFRALVPLDAIPIHVPGAAGFSHAVLAFCLALIALALAQRAATRVAGLGLLLALVLPLGSSPLAGPFNVDADRYLYLSSIGGSLVWAQGLIWLGHRLPRPIAGATLALLLCGLGLQTHRAASIFRDDGSLWRGSVRASPDSTRAWTGLAYTLRKEGDLDGAEDATARALRLDADYRPARVTRVYNLLARKHITQARQELDAIVAEGGADLGGVARARYCLDRDPEELEVCLDPDR